jgi:hypothetical protein
MSKIGKALFILIIIMAKVEIASASEPLLYKYDSTAMDFVVKQYNDTRSELASCQEQYPGLPYACRGPAMDFQKANGFVQNQKYIRDCASKVTASNDYNCHQGILVGTQTGVLNLTEYGKKVRADENAKARVQQDIQAKENKDSEKSGINAIRNDPKLTPQQKYWALDRFCNTGRNGSRECFDARSAAETEADAEETDANQKYIKVKRAENEKIVAGILDSIRDEQYTPPDTKLRKRKSVCEPSDWDKKFGKNWNETSLCKKILAESNYDSALYMFEVCQQDKRSPEECKWYADNLDKAKAEAHFGNGNIDNVKSETQSVEQK